MPSYYKDPKRTPNPNSPEFQRGYNTRKGGGWWRGCPHCHDTQEFCDWLAGWQKAYDEPAEHARLFAKMDRKAQSLRNVTKRYRTACQSTYRQIDAYDEARDELIAAEVWAEWCRRNGKAFSHTATDYFA
jgi:hypothetical protein